MNDEGAYGHGRGRRRPTIREVAGLAGVSIATVSNVVNGHPGVRAGTRERVAAAVQALDYRPDRVARSLIARRGRPAAGPVRADLPRLTAVGYVSADYTARVDVLPHRDDRVTARDIGKTLGGPAANVAVAAAALGEPFALRTALLTVLGGEADSAWATDLLAERGVEAICTATAPGQRLSRCIVVVEANGSRTIINEPVAIAAVELVRFLKASDPPASNHCLHLDGYQVAPLASVMPLARSQGLTTSVHTTGLQPAWRTLNGFTRLRELFQLVFLNREVARDITGFKGVLPELVRRTEGLVRATAPREGAGPVLLTLGENGAVLFEPGQTVEVPAPVVDRVDATGAGDCFAGVFLAAWLNRVRPEDAMRYAVAAASRSVTVTGAQEQKLNAGEVIALAGATGAVAAATAHAAA